MATRRAAVRAKARVETGRRSAKPRTLAASRRTGGARAPRREFGDEVLLEKTGRSRAEWFAILDRFDCRTKGHTRAASLLMKRHRVSPWWSQAITVDYERARGIRSLGEREDGFALTVQRALAVPSTRAWEALVDAAEVTAWRTTKQQQRFRLGGRWRNADGSRGAFERSVAGRYLRFTWNDPRRAPGSLIEIELVVRGEDRSTVKLTHRRIRSAEEREDLRAHWSWALDSLKSWVETGTAIPHNAWLSARS